MQNDLKQYINVCFRYKKNKKLQSIYIEHHYMVKGGGKKKLFTAHNNLQYRQGNGIFQLEKYMFDK